MKIIELTGSHYEMGQQHARQAQDLRSRILKAMRRRLKSLEPYSAELVPYVAELTSAWEEIARPTLEMLRGMAEGLDLKWDPFFRYTIASYLEDRLQRPTYGEGCTVWTASEPITRHGVPILAKNRDYRPDHQLLQCLARAHSLQGYRYLYVTSAGSPAVFCSGMNEAGLAVADTRVTSQSVGPGVARYSVMMEILEHHNNVPSALDYLRQVPHMGDGTLTLIDQAGDMAVFETGHTTYSILRPEHGLVVSTNHFCGSPLRDCWVDRSPPELRGNSQNRRARVATALEAARGHVDAAWAQALMADHGGRRPTLAQRKQQAICRHRNVDPQSITVSTALYLPQEHMLLFANGQPCRVPFQAWPVA
jgi:isopenicillin-N N-acyltransferase-like protein